jgi:hypothetical protein
VPAGTPDHASGGDWSRPSQVWRLGMSALWANALELSSMAVFLSAASIPHENSPWLEI